MNYSNFGMYFFNRHDFKTALDLYNRALQFNPRYADGWRNLGSTYGEMKEYDKAIDCFTAALGTRPNVLPVSSHDPNMTGSSFVESSRRHISKFREK